MRKGIITVAVVAACLALCAAVWPQDEPAGETPALPCNRHTARSSGDSRDGRSYITRG